MTHPEQFSVGPDEFLSVQIAGGSGKPERFLMIGRPYEGLVHVREWSTQSFDTSGDDFDIEPGELLEDIENAYASGLGVRPELYAVRLWLGAA